MRYMDMPMPAYLAQLAVIQAHDTTDRLGGIAVPTLVLAGERDILIPTALSHDLAGLVPGAEWRTVAGGHGCIWEHPDDFNAAFVDFLQRTDA
jgi:3-oxoadipate enol-lactonase